MSQDSYSFVYTKKLLKKLRCNIDRFGYVESEGRVVRDQRGPLVFLSDVERIVVASSEPKEEWE